VLEQLGVWLALILVIPNVHFVLGLSESIYSLFQHINSPHHRLESSYEEGLFLIFPNFTTKAIVGKHDIYLDAIPTSDTTSSDTGFRRPSNHQTQFIIHTPPRKSASQPPEDRLHLFSAYSSLLDDSSVEMQIHSNRSTTVPMVTPTSDHTDNPYIPFIRSVVTSEECHYE